MPIQVVSGATLHCTFGLSPSRLQVENVHRTGAGGRPAANIQDHIGNTNILPFGLCTSMQNPSVAAATAANGGHLTPQACSPLVPAPWMPGAPNVNIAGSPSLNNTSTCQCAWQGIISITEPGELTVHIS